MSRISIEQVKHVAHLARLAITDEEAEMFTKQLDAIITFAEQLNELDTENVPPTSHVLDMKNVMREDVPTPGIPREEVLKNAPDHQDGQFRVPAITDEEAEMFTKQLDAIITFAEQLNELDTENVPPTSHVLDMKNVMREDVPTPGIPREEVLKNAPDHQDGQFRVPAILE
jgi:aspartyl-tRNA(Asn)/glutamyl-tRNA(Gln) amidotransferase subunit C